MATKTRLRKASLARRRRLTPEERVRKSQAIAERFWGLEVLHPEATACFYLARPEEVETRPLISGAMAAGCRVVVPKVSAAGRLALYTVDDLHRQTGRGPFGVDEPLGSTSSEVAPESVDCFVVPGVAFDASGRRCGFGEGYFDRLLSRRAPEAPVVALAFECQLLPAVPADEHDVLMDFICTEDRVLDCRRQSGRPQVASQPAFGKEG